MSQGEATKELTKTVAALQAAAVPTTQAKGTEMTETFAGKSMARSAETASAALVARARAEIEARFTVAMHRPRDMDAARLAIVKECKRPGFAAVARYNLPVGDGISGPSIRFTEAMTQKMGNVLNESAAIYDDDEKRIMRVTVTDLETNTCYSGDVTVEKTTETLKLKDGQIPISVRTNSVGAKTYLVAADEGKFINKQNALVSKQLRTLQLRIIPGDVLEDAMAQVILTNETEDAVDPDLARKKLIAAFDKLDPPVKTTDLRTYLGHEIDTISPAELDELRGVGAAIRDGLSTWKDALDFKLKKAGRTAAPAASEGEKPESLKDKVARQAAEAEAKKGKTPHDADGVILDKKPEEKAQQTLETPAKAALPRTCAGCHKAVAEAEAVTLTVKGETLTFHKSCTAETKPAAREAGED